MRSSHANRRLVAGDVQRGRQKIKTLPDAERGKALFCLGEQSAIAIHEDKRVPFRVLPLVVRQLERDDILMRGTAQFDQGLGAGSEVRSARVAIEQVMCVIEGT